MKVFWPIPKLGQAWAWLLWAQIGPGQWALRNLPVDSEYPSEHNLNVVELLTSMARGWKGPYLGHPLSKGYTANWDGIIGLKILNSNGVNIYVQRFQSEVWPSSGTLHCTSSSVCYHWVRFDITGLPDETVYEIDQIIDGGKNSREGKFRYWKHGTKAYYSMYLKGPIRM